MPQFMRRCLQFPIPSIPQSLFILLSLLCSTRGPAQIGLHPPSVDWQQLRAEHVRVLFPAGYEARARRVASLVDRLATQHKRSIGDKLYDFDLVLQTPNMTVNGFVALGPFRSEFFVTPPQSFNLLSNTDWVDLLTIHEFRHVQQASNERRGITGLFNVLQGQLGWAVLSGIATPNWFAEGDAVIYETALSAGGRGRTPAFSKEFRALLHNDIIYPYAKARNGSLKDIVPDHYRYGYAMLTYARERFGNDVWRQVLHEGAAYKSIFYPFSRALKRQTSLTTRELYDVTMTELAVAQDSIAANRTFSGTRLDGTDRGDIRNYRFPFIDDQGRLLALRTSFQRLPALVEVDRRGGPDRLITLTGIQREPWLDGRGKFVLWTEYRQHPRYTNQNFSEIVVYELASGRKRVLTERGHYVAASLSPDQRTIAAVHFDPLADAPELHLIDLSSGELRQRRVIEEENNVTWPRWSPDGGTLYFFGQNYAGVAIQAWELATDAITTVRERSVEPTDMLRVTERGDLLFTSGRDGIDNVYLLDPATKVPVQLTDDPVGAYYPIIDEDTLYYTSPTPRGERLRYHGLMTEKATGRVVGKTVGDPRPSYFERPAAWVAEAVNLPVELAVKDYPVSDFSNTLGGLKLHSWSFNGSYVTPGLSINFDNALNTVALDIQGVYNINEDRYSGGATVSYGGLYPVIDLTGLYRDRNTTVQVDRTDSLRFFNQEFSQLSFGPTVRVPWQWVSGNFSTTLQPQVGYQYLSLRDSEEGILPDDFGNLQLGFTFGTFQRTAVRQVQPRLGLSALLRYDRALGDENLGERLLWRSSLFLPGLFPTHGLRLDFDAQSEQGENLYQYPDVFRYARGYEQPLNDRVWRLGVDYQLPLLYPDFGILGITYFRRVRLNAFYDFSRVTIDAFDFSFDQSSVGGQVFFDNVWLNAQAITVGVEAAYRLEPDLFSADANDWQFRLLLTGSF